MDDILEKISLSPHVDNVWDQLCQRAAHMGVFSGIMVRVPSKKAEILPSGNVLLYIEINGFRPIELSIPPRHWQWLS